MFGGSQRIQGDPITNHQQRITARGASAFTLVETVLAIGLTAIGLVAILGLVPHGLDVMKAATDQSLEARISQELVGEVMLTDWQKVDQYADITRYFDSEGVELDSADSEFENRVTYAALIEIPDQDGASAGGMRLPGESEADPEIKRVIVQIANLPFEVDLSDPSVREQYRDRINVYGSTVTKMARDRD